MCKIEISKKNVEAAYKVADENGKKLLDALFGKAAKANTPNLDDYKSIKTYEDACEALGLTPIYSDQDPKRAVCEHINDHWDYRQDMPKHIIALMKLETISRALWGRNWGYALNLWQGLSRIYSGTGTLPHPDLLRWPPPGRSGRARSPD